MTEDQAESIAVTLVEIEECLIRMVQLKELEIKLDHGMCKLNEAQRVLRVEQ